MNTRIGAHALLMSSIALAGCAIGGENVDTAALIVQPTDASRAELQQAIKSILGADVTLASDALTRESTLSIERARQLDSQGRRIEARGETPELFRLIKRSERCVLVHEGTRKETVLRASSCKAI